MVVGDRYVNRQYHKWQLLGSVVAQHIGAPGHIAHLQTSIIHLVPYGHGTFTRAQSCAPGPEPGLVGVEVESELAPQWRQWST